jgi:hypothetical protein
MQKRVREAGRKIGRRRGMAVAGATGVAAGTAAVVLGKAARRRVHEEDSALPVEVQSATYKMPPPVAVNGA